MNIHKTQRRDEAFFSALNRGEIETARTAHREQIPSNNRLRFLWNVAGSLGVTTSVGLIASGRNRVLEHFLGRNEALPLTVKDVFISTLPLLPLAMGSAAYSRAGGEGMRIEMRAEALNAAIVSAEQPSPAESIQPPQNPLA